ncbi:MAG: Smr/MutS family protein [Prevotellaceae bacterium]|jgi:DNA mismatch repair protein MutS2|nr:Smr/MutS family protein [Prevotellaceae bacterium]
MIYPESFEQKTGFDKIKGFVQNKCVTQSAKEKVEIVSFSDNVEEVKMLLSSTAEMKTICMLDDSFPDSGYVDTYRFLPKIKNIGNYLEPVELLDLKTALETTRRISLYFNKKENEYPALKNLVSDVNFSPAIIEEIDRVIDHYGKVKDNASPVLHDLRKEIISKQSIVSKRIQSILKAAQNEGIVDTESGITMRDGHAVIPVLAVNKRKIKGLVVGESSTGRTIFIEPIEVVELNNSIRELEFTEQREVIKILVLLTDFMRPYYVDIAIAGNILAEIDFIRAKAYYAIESGAGMPIITEQLQIILTKAKHPVLMKALAKEKKEVVPLDINLNCDQRILLISGPNAGGKSVCIKTVGLLQYMMQCGFLIPASEISEMGIFQNIFIDIGDEQSLENDLSTYSSHLANMKFFMQNADEYSLILIDEFGTGTEPTAGGAIAEAVLTEILNKQAFGLITTHYTNLKYFASATEGIINGAMLFDTQNIQPMFKLETGVPGSSFAFEIARKIGLPENVLKDAESKLGNNQVKMERSLNKIARDRKYWEDKKERIKKTDRYLDLLTNKYERELIEVTEIRAKLIDEAKEEAQRILASVNKEIENTIRTIKESQADKEQTKIARDKLEEIKNDVSKNDVFKNNFTDKKLKRRIQEVKTLTDKKKDSNNRDPANKTAGNQLSVGDKVKINGQFTNGEVLSVGTNNIAVAMGNIIMNVAPDKVVKIPQPENKKVIKDHRISPIAAELLDKRMNFNSILDVRGSRTVEALGQVTTFLDEAMMFGMNEVRILHGKGDGILKEEIRRFLKIYGNLSATDEKEKFGGSGITVVTFLSL